MKFFDVMLQAGEGASVTALTFPPEKSGTGAIFKCDAIQIMQVDVETQNVVGLWTSRNSALLGVRNDSCYFKERYDFGTVEPYEYRYYFDLASALIDERYAFISRLSTGTGRVLLRFWGSFSSANEGVSALLSFNDAQFIT
jgi:hypothetical protein